MGFAEVYFHYDLNVGLLGSEFTASLLQTVPLLRALCSLTKKSSWKYCNILFFSILILLQCYPPFALILFLWC